MITEGELVSIAKSAYELIGHFNEDGERWKNITHPRRSKAQAALNFAQKVTLRKFRKEINVFPVGRLPSMDGKKYVSWLIKDDHGIPAAIAININQMLEWIKEREQYTKQGELYDGCVKCCKDVQYARVIMHELGHILATPELLTGAVIEQDGKRYAKGATPEQEEKAWIGAITLLALALGDHAGDCTRGDDTLCIKI